MTYSYIELAHSYTNAMLVSGTIHSHNMNSAIYLDLHFQDEQ